MATKYLDSTGLSTVWGKIKALIPQPASTSSENPVMDGTAAIGSSNNYARADHVHPSDTSRVPTTRTVNGHALSSDISITASDIGVESGAEVNQNAFSEFTFPTTMGTGHLTADSESDTLNLLAGDNIYISGNNNNNSLSISAVDTTYEVATPNNDGLLSAAGATNLGALMIMRATIFDTNTFKIKTSALPSYVDDVIEAYPVSGTTALSSDWLSATSGGSALTPETGKIYILMAASGDYAVNSQFRWSGSTYVLLSDASGVSAMTDAEINAICV